MKRQLSLVELATYGYTPTCVKEGSWLEKTFGTKNNLKRWIGMSILDDLIRIKTSTQTDDLIKMLDEISVYEKLSVNEQFKDLKTSEVTRTKCPMLAAFVDDKPYEIVLAELVANIYLHVEGTIPDILHRTIERSPKMQRQFEILQAGIAHIEYHVLKEYDHESMKEHVAAVFTKQEQNTTVAAIIVRSTDGYEMYHGTYEIKEDETKVSIKAEPVVVNGDHGIFTMHTYSVLGNNGYRFGTYNGEHIYDVMIGPDGDLFLLAGDYVAVDYMIPWNERNQLNMSKKDPEAFARIVVSIIESVV